MKQIIHLFVTALLCFQFEDVYSQCSSTPDFYDGFTTNNGWTIINKTNHSSVSNVSITASAVLKYNNLRDGREQRIVKQLPFMLNDKFWVAECKIKYISGATPGHLIMSFTENNNDTYFTQTGQLGECSAFAGVNTNQDAIFCYLQSQSMGSPKKVLVGCKDGVNIFNNLNSGIVIPASNVDYYVRLQRTDYGSGVISVYTNSTMTTHLPGSPQCFTITSGNNISNLSHLQCGAGTAGNCNRILSMEIDDIKVYNGQSPCPIPLTPSFTTNSIVCYGSPITCNGTASTSGTIIPINNHRWIVRECDINGNNISGYTEWLSPDIIGAPGIYVIPTINGPVIQCGKYYKISLALQNCGNIWITSSKIIFIECKPIVDISASSDEICSQGTVTLTANVNTTGLPCMYTWVQMNPLFQPILLNSPQNQIAVVPGVTSTYEVTVKSANNCTASASKTITVYPSTYSKNISTGYINSLTNPNPSNSDYPLSAFGSFDDEWVHTNNPAGHNPPLNNPICVNTFIPGYYSTFPPTMNARWVTAGVRLGDEKPSNQGNHGVNIGPYIYEYKFTIPGPYTTATLTINKFGADNRGELFLDGNPIPVVSLMTPTISTNYTIGTTTPITVPIVGPGQHIIKCLIYQEDKYTNFFVEGFINAQCN